MRFLWIVLPALLLAGPAMADIVEIRGKGMMTGKIISQDEKELVFKNNENRTERFLKSDVLFVDVDSGSSGSGGGSKPPLLQSAKQFLSKSPQWLGELKIWTDSVTKKFRDFAGQPLDRSAADKQGKMLANAMDEASKASAEMAKKNARVRAEMKRQEEEAKKNAGSGGGTGRFTSL